MANHPTTPDGRYFVVRGRLWRCTNPNLPAAERETLVQKLIAARRQVKTSRDDPEALRNARQQVDAAKRALGERGPVWWTDGAPDFNRHMVHNVPMYRDWYTALQPEALTPI
jgi:hypothetical protein